jgi:uncharacterized membrane protein YoaK (UPF0700 family)
VYLKASLKTVLFSKETHGPTTMITGNVTQAALDLGSLFRLKFSDASAKLSLKKNLVTVGCFLAGFLLGARPISPSLSN